jgi:hypothetical protein
LFCECNKSLIMKVENGGMVSMDVWEQES